jgi:hypothetical protein
MDARRISLPVAILVLAASLAPVASAASMPLLGISTKGATETIAAGAHPAIESIWIGKWTASSGWGGLDNALSQARAHHAAPLILWYYWGNDGSPTCVANGCNGKSRGEWMAMTDTIASRLKSMGGATSYVVVENEFNKNGITGSYAPTFDGYMATINGKLKATAGVHPVVGFGAWGETSWGLFPKTIASADYMGFQIMRASTRDNEATYRATPDVVAKMVATTKSVGHGKPSILYDLALASYPDAHWAQVQADTLSGILARRAEYAANGLAAIVYRGTGDSPKADTTDYFGLAETTFGLKKADGTPKPAWGVWIRAGGGSAPPPPIGSAFQATFTGVSGNPWWVQTSVSGTAAIASVSASVNGGAPHALTHQSWGAWAASFNVPAGAKVVFTAKSTSGATSTSVAYAWPPK